jgi:hypothetical protein
MDSSADWETKKDAEKRARYAPVLDFFNSLPENRGWTLLQFNFTVGVRGSISNVDRTEPLSFLSTLKALGITSRANLEKIRKVTAKRAFEAHDLLLRTTTQQNPLLERIFQASWEMHLLFNTAYGFPNRDITRPANSVEYLLLVTSSHLLILSF